MPYQAVTIESFQGLDLLRDPKEVGAGAGAALQDLSLDVPGQISTRDGYATMATTSDPAPQRVHVYDTSTTRQVLVSGTKLEAFTAAGVSIAAVAAAGPHAFANFGTPGNTTTYAVAAGDANLRKWNGAAWSTVGGAPANATSITVDTDSNRLVLAGHGSGHRVQWSDAGAPETFTATSIVDLTPGDGETIVGACCWQGLVFVFKRSKFFVFTGESLHTDGTPEFNYRTVNGVGALPGAAGVNTGAVVSTPHGVYFLAADGIYLTTGGPPQLISKKLRGVFSLRAGATALMAGGVLTWCYGRLIAALTTFLGPAVYVWYRETDSWSQWSVMTGKSGGGFAADSGAGRPTPSCYFVNGSDTTLFMMGPSWSTDNSAFASDNGSAIAWNYTSGYYAPAGDKRIKLRGSSVWGSGTVTLQMLALGARSADVADPGGAITLGVSPTVAEGKRRRSCRGVLFAHKLSGTGPATVSRLTHRFLPPSLDS